MIWRESRPYWEGIQGQRMFKEKNNKLVDQGYKTHLYLDYQGQEFQDTATLTVK